MPSARRWSPDAPYLYRCRVTLSDPQGRVLDVRDAVFGQRSVGMVSEANPHAGLQAGTLLLDGQVIEVGPTAEMLDHASDPRTRAFLTGDMVY